MGDNLERKELIREWRRLTEQMAELDSRVRLAIALNPAAKAKWEKEYATISAAVKRLRSVLGIADH